MPKQRFEDALGDLLAQYASEDRDILISALELQAIALREEDGDE